eukprot:750217-Hanusia_phi.AAC.1
MMITVPDGGRGWGDAVEVQCDEMKRSLGEGRERGEGGGEKEGRRGGEERRGEEEERSKEMMSEGRGRGRGVERVSLTWF